MAAKQPRHNGPTTRQWWLLGIGCAIVVLAIAWLSVTAPRQWQIRIHADGQDRTIIAASGTTVAAGLDAAGVSLGLLDRVSSPLTATLSTSVAITVTRVYISETIRSEPLATPRLTRDDPQRPRGYRELVQAGSPGLREVVEAVTLEDGRPSSTSIVRERTLREPTPEILTIGVRADPALDAFRESALGYLGRGGVTRLSPAVVEQTVFELSRLRGDRYGSVRVLSQNGRPWLVLTTFARAPQDVTLFVFWWTDELHAFAQVLGEGFYLIDARAQKTSDAVELGLIVSAGQGNETLAPQFVLRRLPQTPEPAGTWRVVWTSLAVATWRSSYGSAAFAGDGLERLDVQGASSAIEDAGTARLLECSGCPRRRFESIWRRQGSVYTQVSQGVVPSPYATLWDFVEGLSSGSISSTMPLVAGTEVISTALKSGLSRTDVRWTVSGREQDTIFDLLSKDVGLRVTLGQRGASWVITNIGPIPAQGRILFTGTRPVVRGIYSTDTAASAPAALLGDGQRYVWSPDYARLAYERQGVVYVAASDGSDVGTLAAGSSPAWSPDGRQLAIERAFDKGSVIVVVNMDDGRETVLVGGSQPAWAPSQTAAGTRIAYTYSSGAGATPAVYLVDPATGVTSLLASDGSQPLWSPDGSAVVFLTSRQEIAVVTLAPGRVATIGLGWAYTWSVDSKWLAYLSDKPAGKVLVWDRDAGQSAVLLERSDLDGVAWSPDGAELVLSIAGGGGLWLVRSDGANLRKLGDGRDPVWAWTPRAGR